MTTIQMTSNTTPYDVFEDYAVASRIKDTGDCWLWTGAWSRAGKPVFSGKLIRTLAYTSVGHDTGGRTNLNLVTVCEDSACVHPEHLALENSVVGKMLYLKTQVDIRGDCWVWKGSTMNNDGTPRINIEGMGWGDLRMVTVRKFVYCVEKGLPYNDQVDRVSVRCGTPLCVSYKHVYEYKENKGGTCPEGHRIPSHTYRCSRCVYEKYEGVKRCERGHEMAWYEGQRGHVAMECYLCNREDAEQYMKDTAKDFLARWA